MNTPVRIAFNIDFNSIWTGGISYYENLFNALRVVAPLHDLTLLGFISQDQPHYETLLSKLDEVYRLPLSKQTENANAKFIPQLFGLLSKAYRRLIAMSVEPILSRKMRQNGADIVFLRGDSGHGFRIPTLSWFPDFQYLHYPEMFSRAEAIVLDGIVKNIAHFSTRVILSSEAAKRDFMQVVPDYVSKVRVLPFVSFFDETIYSQNFEEICSEYDLPEKFFYLPNQFWKHKNHQLVLDALTLARRENPKIFIVSTGLLSDYRNPRYVSEFLADVSRSGNRNNFIFLGIIPRDHMYAIMRQSQSVLQPSLFEGWSSTVEEAKSLGKTIILSDLPVHREQNPPSVEYFHPFSSQALAEKLLLAYEKYLPGPDLMLEQQARENLHGRVISFGEAFIAIVKEVLDEQVPENNKKRFQKHFQNDKKAFG